MFLEGDNNMISQMMGFSLVFLFIFSIVCVVHSIFSKNKSDFIWTIIYSIVSGIYIYVVLDVYSHQVPTLASLLYAQVMLIMWALCLLTIIISAVKLYGNKDKYKRKILEPIIVLIILIVPALCMAYAINERQKTINTSNLLLMFESSGDNTFGSYRNYTYVVGDDYCKQIENVSSVMIAAPKGSVEIENLNQISNYEIEYAGNDFVVLKDGKQICKLANERHDMEFWEGAIIKK